MTDVTRRRALAAAGAGLLAANSKTAFGYQANSAVALGIIGTGSRGRYVGGIFAKDPRVRIAAICDIQPSSIDRAKTEIPGAAEARVFTDNQELLKAEGIDAVLIATPIFLHPEHFDNSVTARKHVYCEKAAAADLPGVRRVMRAGERAGKTKTIQFGFQQRFGPEYLAAEKLILSGEIGDLLLMRSHWMVSGALRSARRPGQYASLAEEKLKNWYQWKETCGDFIVEQDCHGIDVLNWYAKGHPLLASGAGGKKARPYGDCNDHANITFEYANGLRGCLHGSQICQGWSAVNEQFFGTNGMIEVSRSYLRRHRAQRVEGQPNPVEVRSRQEPTFDAVAAFLDSVVSNSPRNHTNDAAESTLTALLGRMAVETKRVVTWEEMLRSA